jgi:hypothetical protein
MPAPLHLLLLVKGAERYVFLYDEASRVATLRAFGRYASHPELSFNWYDAAVLSHKLRDSGPPEVGPFSRPALR